MTTGKTEYSPDYKSEKRRPLNVVFEQGMERQRLQSERARLEREVVNAVRQALQAQREFGHVCVDVEPIFTAQEELERFEQTNVLEHKGS